MNCELVALRKMAKQGRIWARVALARERAGELDAAALAWNRASNQWTLAGEIALKNRAKKRYMQTLFREQ